MPLHNVGPRDIPTRDDVAFWKEERDAYAYQPPNSMAQYNSTEYNGWGIPPHKMAPSDAIDWVIARYRENEINLFTHDPRDRNYIPLHPKYSWSLALATIAHFLWFKSPQGAEWINNFFGVQEVEPFYEGYAYRWLDPRNPHAEPVVLRENPNSQIPVLRIFRQWERVATPPCTTENSKPFAEMVHLLKAYRGPSSRKEQDVDELLQGLEGVFVWVSEQVREWFLLDRAEDRFPFYRKGRITGQEWTRQQQRGKSPFYGAIDRVMAYHQEAYRSRRPGTVRAYMIHVGDSKFHWCPGDEMRVIPKVDLYRVIEKTKTHRQIEQEFSCHSCRKVRSCVPYTRREHYCCSCYAKQIEGGTEMPTLDKCTMLPECSGCPDRIDSKTSLISIKQRLNQRSQESRFGSG